MRAGDHRARRLLLAPAGRAALIAALPAWREAQSNLTAVLGGPAAVAAMRRQLAGLDHPP